MFDIGGPEFILILFIFLLLFGANKMPELAKGIGKSIREFKKAASGVENEVRKAMEEHEEPLPKKFPAYTPAATPPPAATLPPPDPIKPADPTPPPHNAD
jgi:sec-independent protein translocase protein TatA